MTSDLEQIAEEMERDLVGDRYPDTGETYAIVLYRLWHGNEPGGEGHMSLATVEHIKEYVAGIRAWLAANKESDASIRRILWLEHGHQGLYGDDGEMQCGVCVVDFRRAPLARLIDAWNASRKERQESPQRKAFVEAAILYAAWCDTSSRNIAEIDTNKTFAWINRLGELQADMRAKFRAMIEAEKVDNG